ncbi:MAG: transposase [Chloroflexi bacterium]|nr:transposase [Chloroflexota bacterium]
MTICTDWRAHLFGRVTDGRMELNAAGRLVDDVWHELPAYYRHVVLDAFVVMPDHVHGVIFFEDRPLPAEVEVGPAQLGESIGTRAEEAGRGPAPRKDGTRPNPTEEVSRHGLSEIVRGFKSMSGRRVNALRGTPGQSVWQRGYYEHVVRNEEDLNRIREYIAGNPMRWSLKREDQEPDFGEGGLR